MEVESRELMKRFIVAGLGIGFLPSINIAEELAAGTVRTVQISAFRTCRDLGLIYVKNKVLTRALKGFLDVALQNGGCDAQKGLTSVHHRGSRVPGNDAGK
jgi:DNA-binding transcriptional LysR family regulator